MKPAVLYHVTRTSLVPKIRKQGILPMQSSNWIQRGSGERYGAGEVFAFEAVSDAVRWAAKWDWILSQSLGSGKVSIIEFFARPTLPERARVHEKAGGWTVDTADPISQAGSEGRWFKSISKVWPDQIIGVAVVTPDRIRQVALKPEKAPPAPPSEPYGPSEDRKGVSLHPGDRVRFKLYPRGTAEGIVVVSRRVRQVMPDGSTLPALAIDWDGEPYGMPPPKGVLKIR